MSIPILVSHLIFYFSLMLLFPTCHCSPRLLLFSSFPGPAPLLFLFSSCQCSSPDAAFLKLLYCSLLLLRCNVSLLFLLSFYYCSPTLTSPLLYCSHPFFYLSLVTLFSCFFCHSVMTLLFLLLRLLSLFFFPPLLVSSYCLSPPLTTSSSVTALPLSLFPSCYSSPPNTALPLLL